MKNPYWTYPTLFLEVDENNEVSTTACNGLLFKMPNSYTNIPLYYLTFILS